jgi:signal transduction histidine kinase
MAKANELWLQPPGLIFKVLQWRCLPLISGMASAQPSKKVAGGGIARRRRRTVRVNMKSPFGIRLWILIVSLLLVAGGIIYGLFSAWHRVQQVEAKLTTSQIERFQLANDVRRELQSLNTSLLRYALLRDPQQWAQFEKASSDLDHWIDDHDPTLNPRSPLATGAERQAFTELNHAYDDYRSSARAIYSNGLPALVSSAQLAQLDGFESQAERMRLLVRQLTEAHRTAQTAFLNNASASLASLRGVLTAGVVMLVALVAGMGWVIYRDTIAPLRTKLVLSQTMLEKQEKLATLGTLAAGIAHEIRNPLTSLKARLYTLEKHLQNVPAARKDTDIISAEISRLNRIVQDVLSFARPSEPRLETIGAAAFIGEVQGLMSPDLEQRGVRLAIEPGPDLLIRADRGHLKQVLVNLVRNAAEAIDGAGTVTLRSRSGRIRLNGSETDAVVLEVSDNGRGIRPEIEKRLFDPFFTTKETGTGLGLPIAARIVEKHGGLLQYQTRPGQGTTFGVVLPRQNRDIPASASCSENSAH